VSIRTDNSINRLDDSFRCKITIATSIQPICRLKSDRSTGRQSSESRLWRQSRI